MILKHILNSAKELPCEPITGNDVSPLLLGKMQINNIIIIFNNNNNKDLMIAVDQDERIQKKCTYFVTRKSASCGSGPQQRQRLVTEYNENIGEEGGEKAAAVCKTK